jgi:hypothetical protein
MNPFRNIPGLSITLKTALGGLAAALALNCCDTQVAGTSVGTGNPTEIQVSFKNDSGSVSINGSLDVYAATQIPVPGYSPVALIHIDVAGTTQAIFGADAFKSIADTLWPKGSIEKGNYHFNVIISDGKHGTILRGFAFRKGKSDFVLRDEDKDAPRDGNRAAIEGTVTPMVPMICSLDTAKISPKKDHYLFLYGTGFIAKGDSGKFQFASVPKGSHNVFLLSLPMKGDMGTGVGDSLFVYGMSTSADAGKTNILTQSDIQATVPIPDSLKAH